MPAKGWTLLAGFLVLAGSFVGVIAFATPATFSHLLGLPLLALFSLGRMIVGYVFALAFAIVFGHAAAMNPRSAAVLLPILDVLQAVPILGFFPGAVLLFVSLTGGHALGIELAVSFLIFTSMAWNMAFGVYESLTTIPNDLSEAARAYGLSGSLRFRRLAFPAVVPKLVYNSILSWSNGWFFLVASEIFSAVSVSFAVPGLGSFLADRAREADADGIAAGLIMIVAVVLLLDIFVWRPLAVWAERYKVDAAGRAEPSLIAYERFRWLPTFPALRDSVGRLVAPLRSPLATVENRFDAIYSRHRRVFRLVRTADLVMFAAILGLGLGAAVVALAGFAARPLSPAAASLPAAAALSVLRLATGYGFAVAWTLPFVVLVAARPRLDRLATPSVEVLASVPATALLPVVVGLTVGVFRSVEAGAIILATLSMQWYLLFNMLAGVKAIPAQFEEAARAYGVRGWLRLKRVVIPAILPSFITGSVTAWGAGWNALIIAEYIPFGGVTYSVLGLGSLLAEATFSVPSDPDMIFLSVLTMVAIVLVMNRAIWRPVYRRSTQELRGEEL